MAASAAAQKRFFPSLLMLPPLSEKMKFAIKAALSLTIVYLTGFAQGWDGVSTAASTIMLIAAVGSLENSVVYGMYRIIGTIAGALLGMILIALFAQERTLYLLTLSVVVTLIFHLSRTYRGDTTIFFLIGITAMIVFKNGVVNDDVFLYGIDKTFMTVFGIAVYTLVGILLWPTNAKVESMEHAQQLSGLMSRFYHAIQTDRQEASALKQELLHAREQLSRHLPKYAGSIERGFSPAQWQAVMARFRQMHSTLMILAIQYEEKGFAKPFAYYLPTLPQAQKCIESAFDAITEGWHDDTTITLPPLPELTLDNAAVSTLDTLQRATLSALVNTTRQLYELLEKIAQMLNALHSPKPTRFKTDDLPHEPLFDLFDPDAIKASLVTFLIFWTATLLWIWFNPPGGFYIVTLATALSVITAFTEVRPSLLIIVFSLSFVVSALAYVLILPHITYGWEAALFLLIYGFVGFYFLNPQVSIFFLYGLLTMNLTNTMYFAFDFFLLTLVMFYAFLSLLLLFYYIPFNTKPEHLFTLATARFVEAVRTLLRFSPHRERTWLQRIEAHLALRSLKRELAKIQLWSTQIDTGYFDRNDKEKLAAFVAAAEEVASGLRMLHAKEHTQYANPLIRTFFEKYAYHEEFKKLLHHTSAPTSQEKRRIISQIEADITAFLERDASDAKREEKLGFYESVALYKNVRNTLFGFANAYRDIDMNQLKESRF